MADAASGSQAAPPQAGMGASPPGGMGVTAQGFGQEGYVLDTSELGPLPKPQPQEENFAVGVPYYLPFSTPYRDSWEVFREEGGPTIAQLEAMRRTDGQARALYRLLTMPMLAALKNADVIPADGATGGGKEVQFAKDMLFSPPSSGGMVYPLRRFVKQLALSLFNGYSGFELIPWQPTFGALKGKYTIREIGWRPAQTLIHLVDGQGAWNGFRQRTFFQGRTIDVKIPKHTGFYFANEEAERPFYGVSMFESAFYHHDKKIKLYFIAHLAAQRKAVGMRIGTMPPQPFASDKNMFIQGLKQLGLASWMVLPSSDWQVTNLVDAGQFDFLGLINHHNSQMSKSVLAQWFDEGTGQGSGETTLVDFGQQSDAVFMMMLESIMQDMADTINHDLLPRFIDWNFAPAATPISGAQGSSSTNAPGQNRAMGSGAKGRVMYPQFKWGELTEEQRAAIQQTFTELASAGPQANVTPDFMLDLEQRFAEDLGLDIDYDKIKAERKKQQQQMESQFGEGMTQFGPDGTPTPLPGAQEPPGGNPSDQLPQGGPGQGGGFGEPGGGSQTSGGINPSLLPQGFNAVSASAGKLVSDLIELSRMSPSFNGEGPGDE